MKHTGSTCPSASKAARDASLRQFNKLPSLMQKYKVKMLSGEHFDPEHFMVVRVEADNVESVRDLVNESGLIQWNNVRIYPLTPLDKMLPVPTSWPDPIF